MFPDSSKTTLRQMLQSGRVRVNAEIEKNARREVSGSDLVEVGPRPSKVTLPPELTILHEDDDLIVVVKANGLLTVATEREKETTAQAYLNEYLRQKGERSEEHTSELQSPCNLVCRLLLEKKKK